MRTPPNSPSKKKKENYQMRKGDECKNLASEGCRGPSRSYLEIQGVHRSEVAFPYGARHRSDSKGGNTSRKRDTSSGKRLEGQNETIKKRSTRLERAESTLSGKSSLWRPKTRTRREEGEGKKKTKTGGEGKGKFEREG